MGRIVRLSTIAAAIMLTGCGPNGATPDLSADRLAAFNAEVQPVAALVKARKISHVEGARRVEQMAERTMGASLTPHDRLLLSYNTALAAEVDAGRMTPEMAEYRVKERVAQEEAADQQRRAAALQAYGRQLLQVSAQQQAAQAAAENAVPVFAPPPNRTIKCTSQQLGVFTNTTCN